MENKNITEAVESFVAKNQAVIDDYADRHLARLKEMGGTTKLRFQVAQKYIKVWAWKWDKKESIHAFIDKTTGDIFKPAGLNAPAKHKRGNVFDADNGARAFDSNGYIVYLK